MLQTRLSLACVALASLFATAAFGFDVPRPAENLAFKTMDGKDHTIGEYKGKVLAVILMSPTCPHCQHLTQAMHQVAAQLKPKGLEVIEIAFDEMSSYMPEFIQNFNPPGPAGHAPREKIYSFMQSSVMSPFMVPQMVVIDRTGTIRKQFPAGDNTFQGAPQSVIAEIEPLLAETTKRAPAKRTTTASAKK